MERREHEVVARPLTSREDAVLVALVTRGTCLDDEVVVTDDDRARWLAQVSRTRAGRGCGCGTCPSIELTDLAGVTPDVRDGRVVLEAGVTGAVMLLFIDDDRLSYLELAPLDDSVTFGEFPEPRGFDFAT